MHDKILIRDALHTENKIGDEAARAIAEAFKENSSIAIQQLKLFGMHCLFLYHIRELACFNFLPLIWVLLVTHCSHSDCGLGVDAGRAIAEVLKASTSLRQLDIHCAYLHLNCCFYVSHTHTYIHAFMHSFICTDRQQA